MDPAKTHKKKKKDKMYEEEKDDHPSNIGAHIRGSLSQSVYGKCATSLQYEIL